jgi:multicomponent Na+:H+ antiporter subunit F
MNQLYWAATAALVVLLLGGLVRVMIGPSRADRMLAAQLFSTTGVAVLLMLAHAGDDRAMVDVALILAALAVVVVVAFVRRVHPLREGP